MLRHYRETLTIGTKGPGFSRLGTGLQALIRDSTINEGLCTTVALHTSCSLTINENADPRVLADLESYLRDLVPRERHYRHADDMPTTCRPIAHRRLLLGTWQEVYLWKHRDGKHQRQIAVQLISE